MSASGSLKICRGRSCLSNAPESATILAQGKSVAVGPFRCTSFAIGVRCVVSSLRHGFLIGPTGLTRF